MFKEEQLTKIPEIYSQDGKGEEAIVYLKVQLGGHIWLITEYSEEDKIFFGWTCLDDLQCAELGYISKTELEDLSKKYILKIESIEKTLKEAKGDYVQFISQYDS